MGTLSITLRLEHLFAQLVVVTLLFKVAALNKLFSLGMHFVDLAAELVSLGDAEAQFVFFRAQLVNEILILAL